MRLLYYLLLLNCLPLFPQQIFTFNNDTFFIYDLSSKTIIKEFEYSQVGAILWRPGPDARVIFYKKNLNDSSIICYKPESKSEVVIDSIYPFTDFQVISHAELVIRNGEQLYLWNIEDDRYQLIAGRVSGSYFFYNASEQLLISQTKRNSIEIWDSKGSRHIVATNIQGFFTATPEAIYYATGDRSFERYSLSSMEKSYYNIKNRSDIIAALWYISPHHYLIRLTNSNQFSYIVYSAESHDESHHPLLSSRSHQQSLFPQIVANDLLQIVARPK